MKLFPDFDSFKTTYETGQNQIVGCWIAADLNTPVSAYLKLSEDEDYSFLLESVEGGEVLGRYSAIGLKPDLFWKYENEAVYTRHNTNEEWQKKAEKYNALEHLQDTVLKSRTDRHTEDGLPPMATPGLFGYLGYDMIRLIEDIPAHNPDPLNLPQGLMMRPTVMVIFDNVKQQALITVSVRPCDENKPSAEEAYRQARRTIKTVMKTLSGAVPLKNYASSIETPLKPASNISKSEYKKMVEKTVEYIYAGDIFQAVPSQRFSIDFDLPAVALYRSLRRLNPSPFLFHLQMDDFALVGSSPEILVRVRDNEVTIRPIAGTRKRGKTRQEDEELAADLLSDPKERAEHLMLLDLARNDVGRVAEIGSINVTEQYIVEHYSHVMHIVSNVTGQLDKEKTPLEALFSGFPAGTVSGAPKVRAMEIIEELEPHARRFYGGCIGYLDGHGNIDSCIALRTALVKNGKAYIQAGGGVVADSDPDFEFEETRNKARALVRAAEIAIETSKSENL